VIRKERVSNEVNVPEVGTDGVGEQDCLVPLVLLDGSNAFAPQAEQRADAEDDDGRIQETPSLQPCAFRRP